MIKFETENIKSNIWVYSDAFILVTGNITVNAGNNTYVTFKYCASSSTCKTEINDVFIDEANHICTGMYMYSLIEYSDSYSDTSGSFWQFKGDEVPDGNADLLVDNNGIFISQYLNIT